MTDIPRNELLDKLAAGWRCRRKSWKNHHPYFLSLKENETITPAALVADDWEGEPPGPVRKYEGCSIVFAFNQLKNHGAKFICRPFWREQYDDWTPIESAGGETLLETRDILAHDWEVWG